MRGATLDYAPSGIPAVVGSERLVPHKRAPIHDELYLRDLRELDLHDPGAIVDFAGTYGRMGLPVGSYSKEEIPYLHALADFGPFAHLLLKEGVMGVSVNELRAVALATAVFSSERAEHWVEQGKRYETLHEFELAARWIRDLTTIALHLDDLDDGPPMWESAWLARPVTRMASLMHLQCGLAALLRPFSPQIEIGDEDEDEFEDVSDEIREYYRQPTLRAPLASAIAMQLYNHLAERATYLTCANEKCRRSFVTQHGRAQHGQHRRSGGVKYCSSQCARAQAVREHRRRKAANKGGAA